MKFVVDTNILVSFFRETPVRHIIINSESFNLQLFSPVYALEELRNIKSSISKYSKLSLKELGSAFNELEKCIKTLPLSMFGSFREEAKKIAPHDKDIPFFALALKLDCAIWSNEPAFKKQLRIKVFNTKNLIEYFSL